MPTYAANGLFQVRHGPPFRVKLHGDRRQIAGQLAALLAQVFIGALGLVGRRDVAPRPPPFSNLTHTLTATPAH